MASNSRTLSGLHPSALRRMNAIQVFEKIRLQPGISQREIGATTGIDRSTVSAIIAYFDKLGLLHRQADETTGRRGRPSETLDLRAEAGLLVGIHITPERLLYVSAGLDGNPMSTLSLPALENAQDADVRIEEGLEKFLQKTGRLRDDVSAVGVCVPGLVSNLGRLAESSNLNWRDLNLAGLLADRIPGKILVDNDSRAAGVAEKMFGRCKDVDDYVFIDSASGVGGVLFLDGRAYVGAGGFAGELGHIKVVPSGRLCRCGGAGCLSAYLSEPAMSRRMSQLGVEAHSFADIRKLARQGLDAALLTLDEAGEMLGIAIADFINLFNPPIIVLGGGLALLSEFLLPSAQRAILRQALVSARDLCTIVVSELSDEDTPRGGLALALTALKEASEDTSFPW